VKYCETIADNLSEAGWSWGCVSVVDSEGRTIWIVDAHGYGKRSVVRADEKLTAFVELERAIHQFAVDLIL
jgi:SH3-like domain-containing protein